MEFGSNNLIRNCCVHYAHTLDFLSVSFLPLQIDFSEPLYFDHFWASADNRKCIPKPPWSHLGKKKYTNLWVSDIRVGECRFSGPIHCWVALRANILILMELSYIFLETSHFGECAKFAHKQGRFDADFFGIIKIRSKRLILRQDAAVSRTFFEPSINPADFLFKQSMRCLHICKIKKGS